jgi:hypothetical protein
VLSAECEARAGATERFVREWRDPYSWVRREARERLAGGLWSGPVIERAFDNVFSDQPDESPRVLVGQWFGAYHASARRTLVILPGNVIGPALCAAHAVAVSGASAILKAASTERVVAELVARQWNEIGYPLAGAIEARYWLGGDLAAETDAIADVDAVIAFGSDETVNAVRTRVPSDKHFIGRGTRYSLGLVTAGADLTSAADAAAVDVCMFDQAGCMSPQTIYVVGKPSRALRFAHALDGAMRRASVRLPRMKPSNDEAAAANDLLRRSYVTAMPANSHGLSPILPGPDNGGGPDYLIVVEPQGPPRIYGFGRIVMIMPLEFGHPPVLTKSYEQVGCSCKESDGIDVDVLRALCGNAEKNTPRFVELGRMQDAAGLPSADDFIRCAGEGNE